MPGFYTAIELFRNEIRNAAFQNLGQAPTNPVNAQFYWDTALNRARIYNQAANGGVGAWEDLGGTAGAVTAVYGTAPIVSSGGSTPTISITEATTTVAGSMSAADKIKLDGIQAGATANASDAELRDRSTHTGTQPIASVDGLQTALDGTEKLVNKNVANGYAGLDANGLIAASALPALAITDTYVVVSEAEMLALVAQVGDVAIRTDTDQSFILRATPATTLANWELLRSPTDGVTAVTGTAPITSTGGATPAIGLAALGVATGHLADGAVTEAKIAATVAGAGLVGGAGSALAINAGAGLEVISDALRIAAAAAGAGLVGGGGSALGVGAGTGVVVTADAVSIDTAVVPRKFSADLAAATSQVLTHNLNTQDVTVSIRQTASPFAMVYADVEITTVNTVTIHFATAPAAGAFRATVIG